MGPRHLNRLLTALAAACLGLAGGLRADLAQASPFLPPNSAASASGKAGGPSGPVELRCIMSTGHGTECCIYDTTRKSSAWVAVDETGNDFVVKSIDPVGESATVQYQGRSMKLVLRASKIASAGTAQAAPPANPAFASGQPGVPSPADEQKRLDAVAAEVRRRRLEREKASQGGSGAPAAAPQPPQTLNR